MSSPPNYRGDTFFAVALKQLNSKLASVVAALGSLGQRQERIEGELRTLSNSPKPTIREVRPPYDDDDGGVEA